MNILVLLIHYMSAFSIRVNRSHLMLLNVFEHTAFGIFTMFDCNPDFHASAESVLFLKTGSHLHIAVKYNSHLNF